jgi:hypothetical protein
MITSVPIPVHHEGEQGAQSVQVQDRLEFQGGHPFDFLDDTAAIEDLANLNAIHRNAPEVPKPPASPGGYWYVLFNPGNANPCSQYC